MNHIINVGDVSKHYFRRCRSVLGKGLQMMFVESFRKAGLTANQKEFYGN